MKVIITSKNIRTTDHLKETVEKKFEKLNKYFSQDIAVNVMLSGEKNGQKAEATIRVKGTVFRGESQSEDLIEAVDKVIDKLSSQMAKFKGKIQKKHKEHKEFDFEAWPEAHTEEEIHIVRKKNFELAPMTTEEAVIQMELIGHNFFVFLNKDTKAVSVVYKRAGDNQYGLLETTF